MVRVPSEARPGETDEIQLTASAEGAGERNFLSISIAVLDPNPDLEPPFCRVVSEGVCNEGSWSADFEFGDGQSGVEFIRFTSENGTTWLANRTFAEEDNATLKFVSAQGSDIKLWTGCVTNSDTPPPS